MEADLNACLRLTVRKGWSLSKLNDWRNPVYVTTEKSAVSQVMTFFDYKLQGQKYELIFLLNV